MAANSNAAFLNKKSRNQDVILKAGKVKASHLIFNNN